MIPELPALVYAAGLVFARLGAILMLLPGFGEPSIPVRFRLAFSLFFLFPIRAVWSFVRYCPPDRIFVAASGC